MHHQTTLLRICAAATFLCAGLGLSTAPASAAEAPEIWYTHWYKGNVCSGNVCSTTAASNSPRFFLSGDGFTLRGKVYVGVFDFDGNPIESNQLTAVSHSGFDDGSFGYQFNQIDCGGGESNAFLQAHDLTADMWSNRIFVRICYTL